MAIQAVSIPTKRLATSILSTDMSFQLNNIISWDGTNNLTSADFPTRGFGAFRNSTNTQIEFFEFDPTTIASSSVTIISRGLGYDGGLTANTETKYNWNANETYVELGSDTPQIFQLLRDYIDAALIAGAANATTTLQGLVELATQAQLDAGTATGETGAKLVPTPDLIRGKLINDYAADSVGSDAYAITITPAITAYAAGQRFTFKAGTANTGACTLNVSALGAKDIKKNYNEALATGDILANQIVEVVYDGTNMQMVSKSPVATPTVQTFTAQAATTLGDTTSQFDITNTGGSTYRYTYDGTGTNPGITTGTVPTGIVVMIESDSIDDVNTGSFVVTGSGANYFEVTNASGIAETNKTLTNGYLKTIPSQTYTKPSNLKYVVLEVQGAGAAGGGGTAATDSAAGGGGGAYSKKLIAASSIGTTETLYVGIGGVSVASGSSGVLAGGLSKFGSHLTAPGGGTQVASGSVNGGVASGGDLNINGGSGNESGGISSVRSGRGGDSFLGLGGGGANGAGVAGSGYGGGGSGSGANAAGGAGAPGIIIVTEYYS